ASADGRDRTRCSHRGCPPLRALGRVPRSAQASWTGGRVIDSPPSQGKRQLELPGTSDEEVTAALKSLFEEEGEEPANEGNSFVPGTGASAPPPPSFPSISIKALAHLLESAAEQEGSALAKSRAQLVASRLRQKQGLDEQALSLARTAFE